MYFIGEKVFSLFFFVRALHVAREKNREATKINNEPLEIQNFSLLRLAVKWIDYLNFLSYFLRIDLPVGNIRSVPTPPSTLHTFHTYLCMCLPYVHLYAPESYFQLQRFQFKLHTN